jgi:hypothetical protein
VYCVEIVRSEDDRQAESEQEEEVREDDPSVVSVVDEPADVALND